MNELWQIHIGTIFPNIFPGTLGVSCINRHRGTKWEMFTYDLRAFDPKGRIDDAPFGGGGGMIIKCDVIDKWINVNNLQNHKKIYMSPRGQILNQNMVEKIISQDIVILCGRYEGVDQRVLDHWNFEEISIGDFILHGGEVAAMAMLEACLRKFSVKEHSLSSDSFSNGLLEHHQYTRPALWTPDNTSVSYRAPAVLLSGHYANIVKWRSINSVEITKSRRPDLIKNKNTTDD